MQFRYDPKTINNKYRPIISIMGSSSNGEDTPLFSTAFNIGKIIAEHNITVANGGYTGIMDTTAKGSQSVGGKAIGITTDEITKHPPSKYLTEEFREPTLSTRMQQLISIADYFLILPGSTGTLTELALIWDMMKLDLLPIKPIILFSDKWNKIFNLMFVEEDNIVPSSLWKKDKEVKDSTYFIDSIESLIDILNKFNRD